MVRNLCIFFCYLLILSHQNNWGSTQRQFKFKLPHSVKKSFSNKKNFYLYRSFITGQKRGVSQKTKSFFNEFNLIHLMTPSGLHFSSLIFLLAYLRRKFKNRLLFYTETTLCLLIYFFLPGYLSLRRVAFLRSLFLLNNEFKFKLPKEHLFLVFFILDFFFGTFKESTLSFAYSILFLAIIFLTKRISFFKLIPLFFIGQLVISAPVDKAINISTLLISPFITWGFSLIYPLIFSNLFFIKYFNYSEILISGLEALLQSLFNLFKDSYDLKVNFLILLSIFIMGRKTVYLSISLFMIGIYVNY